MVDEPVATVPPSGVADTDAPPANPGTSIQHRHVALLTCIYTNWLRLCDSPFQFAIIGYCWGFLY